MTRIFEAVSLSGAIRDLRSANTSSPPTFQILSAATPRVLEAALEHGCWQDDAGRLRFPPHVVKACLEKAAKSFVVYWRDPALDFEARNGLVNFATSGAAVTMLDRTYRPSTLSDLYDLARVAR